MQTLIVLVAALASTLLLALALRRHKRLNQYGTLGEEKEQRAESWLGRGGGCG